MKDDALLPCPFCGGDKNMICKTDYNGRDAYAVSCRYQGCHGGIFMLGYGYFASREEAIAAWNTRATLAEIKGGSQMTDYNDGKIHGWNGGDCPVHPETEVKYWMQDGETDEIMAGCLYWKHTDGNGDIIAFQVVKQHVEPKVIWVNEYADGPAAFNTKDTAQLCVRYNCIRIAVKYVEAKDD